MFAAILLATLLVPSPAGGQHMTHRGDAVMGFDQASTAHHFRLYADGGAIEVSVKDPVHTRDLAAIRTHLSHIAEMFADGNFDAPMLVHDSTTVPGTARMSEQKDAIRYAYTDTPAGGRVLITTTDAAALAAVHEFLRYQIKEHKTGDALVAQPRRPSSE